MSRKSKKKDIEPKVAEELIEKQPFEDHIFAPAQSSLLIAGENNSNRHWYCHSWRRLQENSPNTKIFNENLPVRIVQGELSNEWLLGAFATVAQFPSILRNLFFDIDSQAGRYTIRLYHGGKWRHICIDDRIPIGKNGRPVFGRCAHGDLWISLLEKAFAKLMGTYESLELGSVEEAIMTLTGGRPQRLYVNNPKNKSNRKIVKRDSLWQKLLDSRRDNVIMCCAVSGDKEHRLTNGILQGYTYPIMDVRETSDMKFKLIKLQCPWPNGQWDGAWSKHSCKWTSSYIQDMGFDGGRRDGSFFMEFRDFVKVFDKLNFVRMFNDSIIHMKHSINPALHLDNSNGDPAVRFDASQWKRQSWRGMWDEHNAGGCSPLSFDANPRLLLSVKEAGMYFIVVIRQDVDNLSPKLRRLQGTRIGFVIHRDTDQCTMLSSTTDALVLSPRSFWYNSIDLELDIGEYVLTPVTNLPNRKGSFKVEVYSKSPTSEEGSSSFELQPLVLRSRTQDTASMDEQTLGKWKIEIEDEIERIWALVPDSPRTVENPIPKSTINNTE